jgi:hypothetical protein
VSGTVDAPEDSEVTGKAGRRRARLGRLLREAAEQRAAPTVEHLAEALGGASLRSGATWRRCGRPRAAPRPAAAAADRRRPVMIARF